ncbi:MAG: hypothetical protein K2N95_10155 [Lachnospiraceae bacterium]|nr:hypothetical protein [Lachnospiraceae bacterium]
MKREAVRAGMTALIMLCVGGSFGCASGRRPDGQIEANSDDCFVCHDAGRPRVYFEDCAEIGFSGKTSVWDLETNTIFPSDFPPELVEKAQ